MQGKSGEEGVPEGGAAFDLAVDSSMIDRLLYAMLVAA